MRKSERSVHFEANFSHEAGKALHEVLGKLCDHCKGNVVVLFLVVDIHDAHLFASLLHESKEGLKLDVVGLPHMEHFIQEFYCGLRDESHLGPVEIHKVLIVLQQATQPGNKVCLLVLGPTDLMPHL